MSVWFTTPPREAGWYWTQIRGVAERTPGWWDSTREPCPGLEYGPRIPGPETIEAMEAALRKIADGADGEVRYGRVEMARIAAAALARLDAGETT